MTKDTCILVRSALIRMEENVRRIWVIALSFFFSVIIGSVSFSSRKCSSAHYYGISLFAFPANWEKPDKKINILGFL